MSSPYKYYFTYENTFTESNDNFKADKTLYNNDFSYNLKNSQIKNQHKLNRSINNNNLSASTYNYFERKNTFPFNLKKENLLLKKRNKNLINKSMNLYDNSLILNYNNKTNYLNKEKSPIIYGHKSKYNDNSFNINLTNDFKIKNILNNKIRNNKLKTKFENLLDLAMKNYNDKNNTNKLENNVEIKKMAKMEMAIEKIRNKNRKTLFKKQMELNVLCKRKKNNVGNIKAIKEKLNNKLFETSLYKSMSFNNNTLYKNKKNKSFKNSFIHLNEINYNNKQLNKNNSYKIMLDNQNIYRPNSMFDYNRKIIENAKNEIFDGKNNMKFKNKIKYLRKDLKFF